MLLKGAVIQAKYEIRCAFERLFNLLVSFFTSIETLSKTGLNLFLSTRFSNNSFAVSHIVSFADNKFGLFLKSPSIVLLCFESFRRDDFIYTT